MPCDSIPVYWYSIISLKLYRIKPEGNVYVQCTIHILLFHEYIRMYIVISSNEGKLCIKIISERAKELCCFPLTPTLL